MPIPDFIAIPVVAFLLIVLAGLWFGLIPAEIARARANGRVLFGWEDDEDDSSGRWAQ